MLKKYSIGPPSQYLGGNLIQVKLYNGTKIWAWGSSQYVQSDVKNVEEYLQNTGENIAARAPCPLSNVYRPEIDVSKELAGA